MESRFLIRPSGRLVIQAESEQLRQALLESLLVAFENSSADGLLWLATQAGRSFTAYAANYWRRIVDLVLHQFRQLTETALEDFVAANTQLQHQKSSRSSTEIELFSAFTRPEENVFAQLAEQAPPLPGG